MITLGVFLPEQMKLVPWVLVLRDLGLYNSVGGLVLIHVVQGISFTTLFCRNYYVGIPQELMKAAQIDGAGFFRIFWRIVLPLSPPILIVTVIWQFTGIWNEYLYGVTFASGEHQPVTAALIALAVTVSEAPQYGVQSAAVLIAAAPTLFVYLLGGQVFHARPHRRRGQVGSTRVSPDHSRCTQDLWAGGGSKGHKPRDRQRRLHRVGRSVRLRQVHAV